MHEQTECYYYLQLGAVETDTTHVRLAELRNRALLEPLWYSGPILPIAGRPNFGRQAVVEQASCLGFLEPRPVAVQVTATAKLPCMNFAP